MLTGTQNESGGTARWALITGASEGIGRELACVFARDRWNLVLVARNEARLNQLAEELRKAHGVGARVLAQDLAADGAAERVFSAVSDTPVSALVNNAGFGSYGCFAESKLEIQTAMMQVNMRVVAELTHLLLKPMLQRGQGRILNVASTAAFQPGPTVGIYYASKAFVYSFSYALAEELRGTGVSVTTLCPGLTRTEFFARARLQMRTQWAAMEPKAVAEAGYRGMLRGKRVVIPGTINKIASFLARRTPPRITSFFVRRLHKPEPGDSANRG